MYEELINAMESLDEDGVLSYVRELQKRGLSNISIMYSLNCGMLQVGKQFECGVYYLADLIMSGTIYRQALELLGFDGQDAVTPFLGKVLIGVVKNDIHDIGKDIIVATLRSEGFNVIDLGIDVKCDEFIAAVRTHKPDILALSGTMSFALDEMLKVIQKLIETGLRDGLGILVGGICVNKNIAKRIGADYYSDDPIEAIAICRELMGI